MLDFNSLSVLFFTRKLNWESIDQIPEQRKAAFYRIE